MTPKEMQEKYGYTDLTMKEKLRELELTKLKTIEQLKEQGVIQKTPTQANPDKNTAEENPSELKLPPITPTDASVQKQSPGVHTQNPPGTYTVPAVPAGGASSAIHTQTTQSRQTHATSDSEDVEERRDDSSTMVESSSTPSRWVLILI